ncbi:MAG TPA: PLP-dependent aminotransferase family protein [Pantanalinema sp.]
MRMIETDPTRRLAARSARMQSSAIREILKLTQQPDIISLAGGLPAPELFPLEAMQQASNTAFGKYGPVALQYAPTEGVVPLRELIASTLPFPTRSDQILVTSGSQQALHLVAKILLDPGDLVVVESPTYLGALQAFDAYEPEYLVVGSDDQGMIPESLEHVLSTAPVRPKFIYIIPSFQNPSGTSLPEARREEIVAIAERHDVLLVEDDPYGQLAFDGRPKAPLRTHSQSHVLYLGSFSKVFAPGLRIGYVVAPDELLTYLVRAKQATDLQTGTLDQYLAAETFEVIDMASHLARLRQVYGERCKALVTAIRTHLPEGTRWTEPTGGMFVWVSLPGGLSSEECLPEALARGVAFVPGASFCVDGSGLSSMRLNFSNVPPGKLDEGVRRLADAIAAQSKKALVAR